MDFYEEYNVLRIDNSQVLCVQSNSTLDNQYGTTQSCTIYQILGGNNIEM